MTWRALLTGLAAMAAVLTASSGRGGEKPPAFETEDFRLALTEYKALTQLVWGPKPVRDHTLEAKAILTAPKEVDAVCVIDKMTVAAALDAQDKSILKVDDRKPTGGASTSASRPRYAALVGGAGPTSIARTFLTANPYALAALKVEAEVVVAAERKEFTLPVRVSRDTTDTGLGVTVRLSSVRIDTRRRAYVTLEYTRTEGPDAPFMEALYALDGDGRPIGGGRWQNTVEIFGKAGRFDFEFDLSGVAAIETLRCVVVTKHRSQKVSFTLEKTFQE